MFDAAQIGFDRDPGVCGQLRDGARGDDPAGVDQHDAIGEQLDLAEQMGVEKYAGAAVAGAGEHLAHGVPAGRTRPQSTLVSVDLPAPFGPSNATTSPAPTSRSTPRNAIARL
jgi:hypothetical protein